MIDDKVESLINKEYKLITVKRNFGGIQKRSTLHGEKILVKSQFEIHEGDFVISKRQIAHGACAIVPKEFEGSIVSNEYNVMNCKKDLLNVQFFKYYTQLPFMKRYFYVTSDGVHIEKLLFKTNDWLKQKIVIPSYVEQEKITEILLTWDKAIELNEHLIQRKKEQKSGLMENLLTGNERLKGFDGEWRKFELTDLCIINKGVQLNKSDMIESCKYPVINGGITHSGYTSDWNTEKDTVIISEGGNSCGFVNYMTTRFWCGGHCYVIEPDLKLINKIFLYQLLKYNERLIMRLRVGSGLPNIQKSVLSKFELFVPNLIEQGEISKILDTYDKKIELLSQQLQLLKKQKEGLMQLLLTGKVRVKC